MALIHTPLWPAGHLPLRGGDYADRLLQHGHSNGETRRKQSWQPISPLEGEMAGRPEGGAEWQNPLHRFLLVH
jgi:hypothetical protein